MNILGLHFGHDGSACIVKDGRLVAALTSERLSRQKKSHGVTPELLDYVLGAAGMHASEIEAVALSDYHPIYTHGTCRVMQNGRETEDTWNRVFYNEILRFDVEIRGRTLPGYNVGHHLSHCAAAYYTGPFEEAYCLSMDSSGGYLESNGMVAHGKGNKLTALHAPLCMVGLAYGEFTEKLGLGSQMFKAGSLMALAGYGQVLPHVLEQEARHVEESFFEGANADYRKWATGLWEAIARRGWFDAAEKDSEEARNIAASIQYLFEKCVLRAAERIQTNYCPNLCLGGGSFLNCNANAALLHWGPFYNLHLFPACDDAGCAIGAALYLAHAIVGEPRTVYAPQELCYLGREPGGHAQEIGRVAEALADGKIVAWQNGRSEYGPRALGNRSLFADPRAYENRERINNEIKKREWFRPLAPVVLEECLYDWFDFSVPSPYMLFTAQAKCPEAIPAAVHIDQSARMQTVTADSNPACYGLLREFAARTGVPVLLNTSLNGPGEPILETEQDAWRFWEAAPVDMLVLNGEIYER